MSGRKRHEEPAGEFAPYVLVLLRSGSRLADFALHAPVHERFITDLIRRNAILLGGELGEPIGDVQAAYVLRCSVAEARAIAAEDPYVEHEVMRATCVEWRLVGVNPDAIDAGTVIRPADV
ncbi:MAG TPA: hypothetical protein VE753_07630 [Gaiellaceae bacterium]|nr:hypothetical protein [Gaiellaceae bacterium]